MVLSGHSRDILSVDFSPNGCVLRPPFHLSPVAHFFPLLAATKSPPVQTTTPSGCGTSECTKRSLPSPLTSPPSPTSSSSKPLPPPSPPLPTLTLKPPSLALSPTSPSSTAASRRKKTRTTSLTMRRWRWRTEQEERTSRTSPSPGRSSSRAGSMGSLRCGVRMIGSLLGRCRTIRRGRLWRSMFRAVRLSVPLPSCLVLARLQGGYAAVTSRLTVFLLAPSSPFPSLPRLFFRSVSFARRRSPHRRRRIRQVLEAVLGPERRPFVVVQGCRRKSEQSSFRMPSFTSSAVSSLRSSTSVTLRTTRESKKRAGRKKRDNAFLRRIQQKAPPCITPTTF
jgi:hypothetical protein